MKIVIRDRGGMLELRNRETKTEKQDGNITSQEKETMIVAKQEAEAGGAVLSDDVLSVQAIFQLAVRCRK